MQNGILRGTFAAVLLNVQFNFRRSGEKDGFVLSDRFTTAKAG